MNITEFNQLAKYKNDQTAYQMIHTKKVKPIGYRKTPGAGAPQAEYDENDLRTAFRDRIERMRNKPAPVPETDSNPQ